MSAIRSQIHSPLTGAEVAQAIALRIYRETLAALVKNGQFTNHVTFVGAEFVAGIKVKGWMRKEIKVLVTGSEGKTEGEVVEVEAEASLAPVVNPTEVREELRAAHEPSGPSLAEVLDATEETQAEEKGAEEAENLHLYTSDWPEGVKDGLPVADSSPSVAPVAVAGGDTGLETGEAVVEMHAVASTRFRALGHDANSKTLRVEFTAGEVVDYEGVEAETYSKLRAAPSTGKFFEKHIRHLPHRKVK